MPRSNVALRALSDAYYICRCLSCLHTEECIACLWWTASLAALSSLSPSLPSPSGSLAFVSRSLLRDAKFFWTALMFSIFSRICRDLCFSTDLIGSMLLSSMDSHRTPPLWMCCTQTLLVKQSSASATSSPCPPTPPQSRRSSSCPRASSAAFVFSSDFEYLSCDFMCLLCFFICFSLPLMRQTCGVFYIALSAAHSDCDTLFIAPFQIGLVDNTGVMITVLSTSDLRILTTGKKFRLLDISTLQLVQKSRALEANARPAVVCVRTTTTLAEIVKRLAATGLHRVYVLDENEKPVGVISLRDLIRHLLPKITNKTYSWLYEPLFSILDFLCPRTLPSFPLQRRKSSSSSSSSSSCNVT